MAHIEDTIVEEEEFVEPPEPEAVDEEQIVFSGGYGEISESEVEDDD